MNLIVELKEVSLLSHHRLMHNITRPSHTQRDTSELGCQKLHILWPQTGPSTLEGLRGPGRDGGRAGYTDGARRDCRLSVLPPRADLPIALDIWPYFNAAPRKGREGSRSPSQSDPGLTRCTIRIRLVFPRTSIPYLVTLTAYSGLQE